MRKEIKVNLKNDWEPDNKSFFNLLDLFKWMEFKRRLQRGDKPVEELMKDFLGKK